MNESLSAAMKAEIYQWMNDEICANSEQELADRLAGLAEQHFAGVDTTVSDSTDAATVTDEVYRLQSVLRQAREMTEEMRKKDTSDNLYVYRLTVRWLDYIERQLSRHFGVQGKGDSHE